MLVHRLATSLSMDITLVSFLSRTPMEDMQGLNVFQWWNFCSSQCLQQGIGKEYAALFRHDCICLAPTNMYFTINLSTIRVHMSPI